jgi:hypothetical protein
MRATWRLLWATDAGNLAVAVGNGWRLLWATVSGNGYPQLKIRRKGSLFFNTLLFC